MSKSYSKIRHMQESNLMLERRMLSERRMLLEEDKKDGDIEASAREQGYIDGTQGTMTDAVFQVYTNGVLGQKQYFYNCVSDRDLPLDKQIPEGKVGAIVDQNNKMVTVAELGLIPGYQNKLSVACKPVYDDLAKWRQTFCANLKNKTKPNYAWNCPDAEKPVPAAAETPATGPATPAAPTGMSPEQMAEYKNKQVNEDQKTLTNLTNFYNSRLLMLDKEDGTMKTDQELETDVKTWNNYLIGQGNGERIAGGPSFPLSKEIRSKFRSLVYNFGKSKPNLTQPNGGFNAVSSL
jgi:hypothetical protein